jgi:hypothetical protein
VEVWNREEEEEEMARDLFHIFLMPVIFVPTASRTTVPASKQVGQHHAITVTAKSILHVRTYVRTYAWQR